ncbi:ABC transporter permease [Reinekea blandensis]|uniref:Transport permease protein n=1 Tax=Reinekea blandensis MED297 TaxID=314283 RepID=A4BIX5_9GAMM|nr:ABC transporter permease [Reinekea blandensis]EAR07908.1 teichoic acid ABC transporter permease [Reinekea sp. MED297] [Reinekea blandensis MED297]
MFIKSLVLAHTMAAMRLKSEASKLYLSYLWWILEPMLYVAVFYFAFSYLLNRGGENFLVFLMCGKIPLMWYTKTLIKNSMSLTTGKGLMGQRDFPKFVFPYSHTLEAAYKETVVYLFLVAFVWLYGFEAGVEWLYLLALVPVMLLLILSTGMVAAYITVYVPDFRMIIAMFTMALLFVSGVFWDVRALPDPRMTELMLIYNPFAFMLDAHRQVLMYRTAPDWTQLGYIAGGAALLLLIMHGWFASQSQRIARRLYS